MCKGLGDGTPAGWQSKRGTVLSDKDVTTALTVNPEYGALAPLTCETKAQTKLTRAIGTCSVIGAFVGADPWQRCKDMCSAAVGTAACIYAVYRLVVTWPQLQNEVFVQQACEECRKQLGGTKAVLSDQV